MKGEATVLVGENIYKTWNYYEKGSPHYSWNPFSSHLPDQVLNSPAREQLNRWGDANVAAGQSLHLYVSYSFLLCFFFPFFFPPIHWLFRDYVFFSLWGSFILTELCRFEKQGPLHHFYKLHGSSLGCCLSLDSAGSCLANEFFPVYRPTHLSHCFLISLRLCIRRHQVY